MNRGRREKCKSSKCFVLLFENEVQWRIVSIYVQPLEGIVGNQKEGKRLMDFALHEAYLVLSLTQHMVP